MVRLPNSLDSTATATALECWRRFYYQWVRHWWPATRGSAPAFGAAIHEGLAEWYSGGSDDQALTAYRAAWERELGTCELIQPHHSLAHGEELLLAYFKRWRGDLERWQILEVEVAVKAPLISVEDFECYWVGRVDLVVRWPGWGLVIVDHKTASSLPRRIKLVPHLQLMGYVYTVELLMEQPVGAALNYLRTRGSTPQPTDSWFKRTLPAHYNETLMSQWKQTVLGVFYGMLNNFRARVWPVNFKACHGIYGECPYLPICMEHADPTVLDNPPTGFQREVWEPFAGARTVVSLVEEEGGES